MPCTAPFDWFLSRDSAEAGRLPFLALVREIYLEDSLKKLKVFW